MVLISCFVKSTFDMTDRNKSRLTLQGPSSAVVKGSTSVEAAARVPLTVAVVVAVIISIIVLLAGSG